MSQNVVPELPEAENEFDEELVVKSQKRKRIAKKKLTVDDLTNTSKGLPALADKTFSSFKPSYSNPVTDLEKLMQRYIDWAYMINPIDFKDFVQQANSLKNHEKLIELKDRLRREAAQEFNF